MRGRSMGGNNAVQVVGIYHAEVDHDNDRCDDEQQKRTSLATSTHHYTAGNTPSAQQWLTNLQLTTTCPQHYTPHCTRRAHSPRWAQVKAG
jgi:hypothetical protein